MAAIDKTYVTSYKDYTDYREWAVKHKFKCPNGMVLYPSDYIYEWDESDFDGEREIPIMNTPQTLDYFLIKHCPLGFVQERMAIVYGEEYYNSVKNGTSVYDTFKSPKLGRKFKRINRGRFSRYNTLFPYYRYNDKGKRTNANSLFSIDVLYDGSCLWYNEEFDKFLLPYELGISTSSGARGCKTVKALMRKIRKWKLPIGAIVKVCGRYVGEEWEFRIK